jgi:type IV fimbrial biogenesis protein FimT
MFFEQKLCYTDLMLKKFTQGLSLIELTIVIALLAILSSFAILTLHASTAQLKAKQTLSQLQQVLNFAKAASYYYHDPIIVCPSQDQQYCTDNWQQPLWVFVDRHHDHILHADDLILYTLPPIHTGHLNFHGFQSQSYLQFTAQPTPDANNASLQYCPHDNDAHYSHALIISHTGKIRYSIDANQDGIDEDAKGEPLSCV